MKVRRLVISIGYIVSALLAACGGGGDDQATANSSAQVAVTGQAGSPAMARALAITSVVEATSSALTIQAVNLQDAIAILKMIVGLDVNGSGQAVTAYQAYAADVDGNGKVELADAITVLKRVVGLETPTASWLFFNQAGGAPVLGDKLNPGLPANLTAAVVGTATSNVGLVAVLRGDVVGSSLSYAWTLTSKPSGSGAVLTGPTAAIPGFTADLVGSYVATMTVSDGTNSASTSVTLAAAIPGTPGMPTIVAAAVGDTTASIAFTAGLTSGLAVTYTASCSATGSATVTKSGATSPLSLTGLVNAKTYSCTITPVSSAGTGSASAAVSVSPIAAPPLAPTIGTATARSAAASISFYASTSGGTATSFSVTCTPTNGTAVTATGTLSPILVSGLANGTSYLCAVKAFGSGGASGPSNMVSLTPITSGENPNASPFVLPLVGDYYVYSDTTIPTFPAGLMAIGQTYVNYYKIVNYDGSLTRSTSSSLSTALMSSAAYNSLGQLVSSNSTSRNCNYYPAYGGGAPRNSIVGDLFSGNASETCVPTTSGAATGWAHSFTGKVDSAETVTVGAGTFNTIKTTINEIVTGAYVDTISHSVWVDKVTGRAVKSTYTLNERLVGAAAISYQESGEIQLLAYSFNGQAPVGAAIKRFAGYWNINVWDGATISYCKNIVVDINGSISGGICDSVPRVFSGSVNAAGDVSATIEGLISMRGTLTSPTSGTGTLSFGANSGTWSAVHN